MPDTHSTHARVGTVPTPAAGRPNADPARSRSGAATGTRCRRLQSAELLCGDTEIEIQHGDVMYRLRLTSLGKLILTK